MELKNVKSKIIYCLAAIIFVCSLTIQNVNAAGLSVTANKRKVYVGDKITFTVRVSGGAGKIHISGAKSDNIWLDNTSQSYSITASHEGTIRLSASGVIADYKTEKDQKLSSSASVQVVKKEAPKPSKPARPSTPDSNNQSHASKPTRPSVSDSNNQNHTSEPTVEETRSKNNNLSSLSVSNGKLNPTFSSNKQSYSVNLTSDIETITIDAKASDSKAKISGLGKKDVVIGSQTFEIVVTAENGSRKTYAITVNVSEKPTTFTKFNDKNLGILKDVKNAEIPEGYKGTTVKLEEQDIQAWTNEKNGLTLVYLMDEENNKDLYIYEDGKILGKYQTITVLGREYVIIDIPKEMSKQKGFQQTQVKIGEIELNGWSFDDIQHKDFSLVYLMNDKGEKKLYVYDHLEGTLQRYIENEDHAINNVMVYALGASTIIFALAFVFILVKHIKFKKTSILTIKEYYERRNNKLDL